MSIQERLTKIFVEHLGIDASRVTPEATFEDLGADSMDHVELIMNMEEEFNVEIPDVVAERITTVQQAIDFITEEIA